MYLNSYFQRIMKWTDFLSELIDLPINEYLDHQKSVRSLKKIQIQYGFQIPKYFYEEINYKIAFQIFNEDGIMIFQSFQIFDQMSYTIDQIKAHPWHELFEREDFEESKIIETTRMTLLTGQSKKFHCRPHLVKERMSEEKKSIKIQLLKCYPVFHTDTQESIGYLATMKLSPVSNNFNNFV